MTFALLIFYFTLTKLFTYGSNINWMVTWNQQTYTIYINAEYVNKYIFMQYFHTTEYTAELKQRYNGYTK